MLLICIKNWKRVTRWTGYFWLERFKNFINRVTGTECADRFCLNFVIMPATGSDGKPLIAT